MSCSATTSANSFAGGGVDTAGVGTAGVGEVGGGSGARETDGCGETTGAAGSVTAAPVGAGACACTSWGRFAQPTRIKARMRRANPARRDFPYIMDRLSFRFNDVQRGSRMHMPGGHEERPQIVREPLVLRKTLFYQAPAVSKSDVRHFAGNFAADSEPSRGTEGRKRVKTHPKDQSGPVPERRFLA